MVSETTIKVTLTPHQIKRLMNTVGELKLQLKKGQLMNGKHVLSVTKRLADKVAKNRTLGKGIELKISNAVLNRNRKGGFIQALAPIILPALAKIGVDSALKAGKSDSKQKRQIQRRLDYLKGNGSAYKGAEPSNAFQIGHGCACQMKGNGFTSDMLKDQAVKLLVNQLAKSMLQGNGRKGGAVGQGDLADFWEGFKFGFTSPVEALDLGIHELDNALSSPKKKSKKKGKGMEGSGIMFY